MAKEKFLFVCTHNSSRSQMAEGLLRTHYSERFDALSAGTAPSGVHPFAIAAMGELGIDISGHTSQHINDFAGQEMAYVVTICDHAKENCPYFPATRKNFHYSFPDPSAVEGTDAEKLAAFRTVRDAIKQWLDEVVAALPQPV